MAEFNRRASGNPDSIPTRISLGTVTSSEEAKVATPEATVAVSEPEPVAAPEPEPEPIAAPAPTPAPAPSTEPAAAPSTTPKRRSSSAAALQGAPAEEVKNLSKNFGNVDIKAGNIGAGAGGGFGLNAPGMKEVRSFAKGTAGGFDIDQECKDAWQDMLNDNTPCHWMVGKYTSNGKALEFANKGSGRLAEFQAALRNDVGDSTCGWGGFRCYGVDDRGNTVSKRAKIVFVQYMPSNASGMRKAKMGTQKGAAKNAFMTAHLDLCVDDVDGDLEKQELVVKLQSATGAHKPNGYEFEVGEFVDADYYNRGIGKDIKAETSTKNSS